MVLVVVVEALVSYMVGSSSIIGSGSISSIWSVVVVALVVEALRHSSALE